MEKKKLNLLVTALIIALFSVVAAVSAASDEDNAIMDQDQINSQIVDAVPLKPFLEGASPAQIEETIAKMSYVPSVELAKKYSITTIRGKKVDVDSISSVRNAPSPKTLADRPVGSDPAVAENEPSIAAKPNNTNYIVAASHSIPGNPCVAYYSLDHGETWSGKVSLPLLDTVSYCSDPVVRWAPDSSKVYAAYMNINASGMSIVVSKSIDNGKTWSTPVIALAGTATYNYDKPWLDVHTFWSGINTNNKVYVSATKFYSVGGMDIAFTRSTDGGVTWAAPLTIASSPTGVPTLQGSRPIGGKSVSSSNGNVTVCWYNSGTDSWLYRNFSINCRNSINYGSSFGSEVTAFNSSRYMTSSGGTYFELPYYLGPNQDFHRWWGGMFPSIITTYDNVLHIVFTASPVDNTLYPASPENGNIYYIKSAYPYTRWSRPIQLNDDYSGMAQGYPTITAKRVIGGSVLVAAWEDHRNSPYYGEVPGVDCGTYNAPYQGQNCLYDTYSVTTNPGWGPDYWNVNPNQKLTDASSVSQYDFIGDYIDSSTSRSTSDKFAQVIWTDRSSVTSKYDYYGSDVFSDQVNT